MLTGESISVDKSSIGSNYKVILDNIGSNKSMTNEDCLGSEGKYVYMGTTIVGGTGKAVATKIGMETKMGAIAHMLGDKGYEVTPLEIKLKQVGKYLTIGCIIICALVTVCGVIKGEELFSMILAGVSMAVAAIPEGLPAAVTIALALGVQRMYKRNALIRRLSSVETLGCANIICTDKTGTLTKNKMEVKDLYVWDRMYEDILDNKKNMEKIPKKFYEIAMHCNSKMTKDPIDKALINLGENLFKSAAENKKYHRKGEVPFDSERKIMSVRIIDSSNCDFLLVKGAPEIIVSRCTKILVDNKEVALNRNIKEKILKKSEMMSTNALRVIGLAYRDLSNIDKKDDLEETENGLVFVGFAGMKDPPKKECYKAVEKCIRAGIKPVMITGDHKLTAVAIAKEIGLYKNGDIALTGKELDAMDENEFIKNLDRVSVYARVSPRHKLYIVKVLKKMGNIVAMTGDGVNDAPAIREADIGISMGESGSDVAREASSMVLLDDNFSTIVDAIEEGRIIYDNIRRFVRYMLSCNIGEVFTMFFGMMIGLPLPLLPIQILWVNLVTDGLPAIALGFEKSGGNVMKLKPRKGNEGLFAGGLSIRMLLKGFAIGATSLLVYIFFLYLDQDVALARTGCFASLILSQLIYAFECKTFDKTIFEINVFDNVYLAGSVMLSGLMMLGVIYIPTLQDIFKTVPLDIFHWEMILCGIFTNLIMSLMIRIAGFIWSNKKITA
jgi:P-type Ca2+ transporter type 2C